MSQTSTKNTSFETVALLRRDEFRVRQFLKGSDALLGKKGLAKYHAYLNSRQESRLKSRVPVMSVSQSEGQQSQQLSPVPETVPVSKRRNRSFFQRFVQTTLGFVVILSLVSGAMIFGPWVSSKVLPVPAVPQEAATTGTPLGGDFTPPAQPTAEQITEPQPTPQPLPPRDETLPDGNWVIIPRIGVRTEILESEVAEPSLEKGVWRVPDFSQPGDHTMPMILAAHRYGYKWWWNSDYWRYHSFNKLPDLEPGDLIEVIADKRKYIYEVYAGEMTTEISDYHADVILYTCKYLNAPQRYVRYARYIPPSVNTQEVQLSAK